MEQSFGHGGVEAADAEDDAFRALEEFVEAVVHDGCTQEGRRWGRHIEKAHVQFGPAIVVRIAWRLTQRITAE